jgi:hypothetical protein
MITADFLMAIGLAAEAVPGPRLIPWPIPGNPAGLISFENFGEWRKWTLGLSLSANVPLIVAAKFERAQKLHMLAWLDFDLIKASELVAVTALELALMDRYGPETKKRYGNASLAHLLRYLPEYDDLTDDKVPLIQRCGGTVIDLLTGKREPSLADIRNDSAHGDPFDGFPWAGLLELIRDLINYAYRNFGPP